jgi:hypothetical protein
VGSLGDIDLDGALRRLQAKLTAVSPPNLPHQPPRRESGVLPPPWEMTPGEFEAAAEPSVDSVWGTPRFRGLSRSVLRRELHFMLRCPGSPDDGYRVRVPAPRADLYTEPHRAFIEAALADGLTVPPSVLSNYPELRDGGPLESPPQLDPYAAGA